MPDCEEEWDKLIRGTEKGWQFPFSIDTADAETYRNYFFARNFFLLKNIYTTISLLKINANYSLLLLFPYTCVKK